MILREKMIKNILFAFYGSFLTVDYNLKNVIITVCGKVFRCKTYLRITPSGSLTKIGSTAW